VKAATITQMLFSSLRKIQGGNSLLVLGNIVAIGVTRVGGALIDGLTYILVARYFGPSDYGHYLSILAFLNLIDLAADMTLMDITVREISKDPDRTGTWLAASTSLRLIVAGIGFVAYLAYVYLGRIAQTPELLTTAWIASLILPVGALRMPLAVFRAQMKMHFELGVILITRLVNLALFFTLMHYHGQLYQFFLATFLSRMLLAVLVWGAVLGWLRVRPSLHLEQFRSLIRESIPMGLSGVFVAIQLKVDILIVASVSGAAAAGLYGAVAQLPEYSLLIPSIITTPLLPILSRSFGPALRERFQQVYQNLFDGVMTIVTPIAVVAMVMPLATVTFLFGKRFAPAANVLPLLVLSIVFMWFSHSVAIAAVAAGLQRSFIWIQSSCVAAYLLLSWTLIPLWGFWGAATARLIGTIIAPFLTYYVVKNRVGFTLETRALRRTIFAGLVMAGAVMFCSRYPLLLAGAVGALVYGATQWAIRTEPRLAT
jgi:O-antigen/teichoic acid export membrane protein